MLTGWLALFCADAQPITPEDGGTEPRVALTLLIVPERSACSPNGYRNYGVEDASDCEKLTVQSVERLKQRYQNFELRSIPPSTVSLGESLGRILNDYRSASKEAPDTRLSIIFVFEWQSPQSTSVTLERTQEVSAAETIPSMVWHGELDGELRWIHHERADAALVSNQVRWKLTIGEHTWHLRMGT
jgi:hypothetical protein